MDIVILVFVGLAMLMLYYWARWSIIGIELCRTANKERTNFVKGSARPYRRLQNMALFFLVVDVLALAVTFVQ